MSTELMPSPLVPLWICRPAYPCMAARPSLDGWGDHLCLLPPNHEHSHVCGWCAHSWPNRRLW